MHRIEEDAARRRRQTTRAARHGSYGPIVQHPTVRGHLRSGQPALSAPPDLLWAGVAAAALYVAIVDIGAEPTPGYSHVSQPVSSLYRLGAVLALPIPVAFVVYNMLMALFGAGVATLARDLGG